ncbi:hypothetical protein H0H93_008083, partial [Arthromyces matolae]
FNRDIGLEVRGVTGPGSGEGSPSSSPQMKETETEEEKLLNKEFRKLLQLPDSTEPAEKEKDFGSLLRTYSWNKLQMWVDLDNKEYPAYQMKNIAEARKIFHKDARVVFKQCMKLRARNDLDDWTKGEVRMAIKRINQLKDFKAEEGEEGSLAPS